MNVQFSSIKINLIVSTLQKYVKNIQRFLSKKIPGRTISSEMIKSDIWRDLSLVYYKYEDGTQKRAFREILADISNKINDGNWDTVYRKLYSIDSNLIS
jgi:hypothetical protein